MDFLLQNLKFCVKIYEIKLCLNITHLLGELWEDIIMISAGDIRNGITFELDGKVMQVIEFQHV